MFAWIVLSDILLPDAAAVPDGVAVPLILVFLACLFVLVVVKTLKGRPKEENDRYAVMTEVSSFLLAGELDRAALALEGVVGRGTGQGHTTLILYVQVLRRRGEYHRAFGLVEAALRRSKSIDLIKLKARILADMGDAKSALACLAECPDLPVESVLAILIRAGQFSAAREHWSENVPVVAQGHREHGILWALSAVEASRRGASEECRAALEGAMLHNADCIIVQAVAAYVTKNLAHNIGSASDRNRFRMKPRGDFGHPAIQEAWSYLGQGDEGAARRVLGEAIENGARDPELRIRHLWALSEVLSEDENIRVALERAAMWLWDADANRETVRCLTCSAIVSEQFYMCPCCDSLGSGEAVASGVDMTHVIHGSGTALSVLFRAPGEPV